MLGGTGTESEGEGEGEGDQPLLQRGYTWSSVFTVLEAALGLLPLRAPLKSTPGATSSRDSPLFPSPSQAFLGLSILNHMLVSLGSKVLASPSLCQRLKEQAARMLIYLSVKPPSLIVVPLRWRTFMELHACLGRQLLTEACFFMEQIVFPALEAPSLSVEEEEMLVHLLEWIQTTDIVLDLFNHYHTNIFTDNIIVRLCAALSKRAAFNAYVHVSSVNILCLQCVLSIINSLRHADRGKDGHLSPVDTKKMTQLSGVRKAVREAVSCMESGGKKSVPAALEQLTSGKYWAFVSQLENVDRSVGEKEKEKEKKNKDENENEKHAVEMMKKKVDTEQSNVPSPGAFALFLRNASPNRVAVGEFLGGTNQFNVATLSAYCNLFDFSGLMLDDALRRFLESFRLPGEAQQISRIMEAFSQRYHECNPTVFSTAGTAFVLSFSLIMLNTDAHNSGVRQKMSEAEFIRNNRGIDDGKDIDDQLLKSLFGSIVEEEIMLSGDGSFMSTHLWTDILARSASQTTLQLSGDYQHISAWMMFLGCWKPSLTAFGHLLDACPSLLSECLTGYDMLCHLAHGMGDDSILDVMMHALYAHTGLKANEDHSSAPSLAEWGLSSRMMESTRLLIHCGSQYGSTMGESWTVMFRVMLQLQDWKLLTAGMLSHNGMTSLSRHAQAVKDKAHSDQLNASSGVGSGFFGLLGSVFSGGNLSDESSGEKKKDTPAVVNGRQIVDLMGWKALTQGWRHLSEKSLGSVLRCGMKLCLIPSGDHLSLEIISSTSLMLEILSTVTVNNSHRVWLVWPNMHEFLSGWISYCTSHKSSFHFVMLEHCIRALLFLITRLLHREEITDSLLVSLNQVSALPQDCLRILECHTTPFLHEVVASHGAYLWEHPSGQFTLQLLRATADVGGETTYGTLRTLIGSSGKGLLCTSSLESLLSCIQTYSTDERAIAMDLYWHTWDVTFGTHTLQHAKIPFISVYGIPVLKALSQEIISGHSPFYAASLLQKCLLDNRLSVAELPASEIRLLFSLILCTLLEELLKAKQAPSKPLHPSSPSSSDDDREDVLRVISQCAAKALLFHMNVLVQCQEFWLLWSRVLTALIGHYQNSSSDMTKEAIPEYIKNVVLVLSTTNFAAPSDWDGTWLLIAEVSPSLVEDLQRLVLPPPAPESAPAGEDVEANIVVESTVPSPAVETPN